jgi:predicted peroxiredoxin
MWKTPSCKVALACNNLNKRDLLEEVGVDGRVMFKLLLKVEDWR